MLIDNICRSPLRREVERRRGDLRLSGTGTRGGRLIILLDMLLVSSSITVLAVQARRWKTYWSKTRRIKFGAA